MWIPEVRKACPKIPILILGTKSDLKHSTHLSERQGLVLSEKCGADGYVECSAKTEATVSDFSDCALL
ncbi:hypothetical protein LAZ67_14001629 [Cordylochernes scorpioides]|uniref:Uncharacterized protein n=1 Tax=Cordylochernes scorpioides TaxID=51811 RepID=A0ABY6L673_9ARAC|nr:hypothetical protein LAZ67_14001629 [Cordylochernes scorpioides]